MYDEQFVRIEKVDNGYVVDWRGPDDDTPHHTQSWPQLPRKKTHGREIFTSKKKALDFASQRL